MENIALFLFDPPTQNTLLIYYNTAARGLTDIYARLPRVCSARESAYISVKSRASCVITFIFHFAKAYIRNSQKKDDRFPSSNGNCSKLLH